jgi:D-xylono/L-arabinono-1,4-lactonase
MSTIEKLTDVDATVGEGPMWDVEHQRLLWTDIRTGRMFSYDPATDTNETIHKGYNVAGPLLNRGGGLLLCIWDGLALWRSDDDWVRLYGETHEGELLRFNDAIADPEGRVFAGTFISGKLGKLYRFDLDGSLHVVEEGVGLSNGMGFSPDLKIFYFTDSAERTIYAYDYNRATGEIKNRRRFTALPKTEGIPDGMTVDAEGHVWSAIWYGGSVVRFDPEGKEERRIRVPAHQVASVMFGGKDLSDLYITTADIVFGPGSFIDPDGYDWDAYKNGYRGGELFRVRVDVQGREEFKANFAWPKR